MHIDWKFNFVFIIIFFILLLLLSEAKKSLKSSLILQAEFHLHSLILQGQAIQVIVDCVPKSGIEQWSRVVEAGFLIPFCEKGTPAAASNSLQPGEMEDNS